MENIVNTFYKGNINKFGFGGWNTTKSNMKEILWSYPYPSTLGRQIDKYFQKSNVNNEDNSKHIHQNYIPSVYSKVLPPKERVDFSGVNAQELKPITISQYKNFDNHGFMNTQTKPVPTENFSPALIRMELLERKMQELEDKTRLEMKNNLNEMNDKYIDPRFKQFLDKNQGKYDVFGNDPDPLMERRDYVKNNLGNLKNKMEEDDAREYRKRKKKTIKKKKNKKRKINLFEDADDMQEKSEEDEKDEGTYKTENNKITDSPLQLIQNINNLPKRNSIRASPSGKNSTYISPKRTSFQRAISGPLAKKQTAIMSPSSKSFFTSSKLNQRRASVKASVRGSVRGSIRGSVRGSVRGSAINSPNKRGSISGRRGSVKIKEEDGVEKVLGDIGYGFEGQTNKERELQFETNRIGKDFDKLLHEMKQFQQSIKKKLNMQHSDEKIKLNLYKDIFLLDNRKIMKYAVDKALNNINEPFDVEEYKKKLEKEKLDEINNLIDEKLENYNYDYKKLEYGQNIYDEKMQMIHNNIINGYEYRKYRQKVNNKVTTLPNIFIKGGQMIMDKSKKEKIKKSKNSSTEPSEKTINNVFKNIREETIHFGDTVKDDDEFINNDKSQISKLPQIPQIKNLKEGINENANIDKKSENWASINGEVIKKDKENKEDMKLENKKEKLNSKKSEDKKEKSNGKKSEEKKEKTNSKKSKDKKENSKNKINENNEEKEIEEKKGNKNNEKDEGKENKDEGEEEKDKKNEEKENENKVEDNKIEKEDEVLDIYKDDDSDED